ncbi:MAG TPA: DUF5682 family protein [Drouetiella sp.]|jgi:Family of unknown function (DUF5682)
MKISPDTTDDAIAAVSEQIEIDVGDIKNSVDRVLSDRLFWFPVRHHSPTVARHLQEVIQHCKPKMLFIEGPADCGELITHLVDSSTKPPIALYSSYRDDDNVLGLNGICSASADIPACFASWYPMLTYSPEYVAMVLAKKMGIAVTFIDLPHYALIKPATARTNAGVLFGPSESGQSDDDHDDEDSDSEQSDGDDNHEKPDSEKLDEVGIDKKPDSEKLDDVDDQKKPASGQTDKDDSNERSSSSEQLIIESSFYQHLAKVAGYRTFNEAWDALFEIRDFNGDNEFFRREVATFCAASRATSSKAEIALDGTLERERFMMKTIRETMQARNLKAEECMVICGGFHLFLDTEDTTLPPQRPAGTVYNTIVPYSFFRFSKLSGYGAGNRAPQFYQTLWELRAQNRESDLLIEHVVAALKQARRLGEPLSSADAISTCQHAEMLARLRGRAMPILDDIHDALITCCCKGDPDDVGVHLMRAITEADIGTKIGRVTAAVGRLPVVSDFYTQMEDLKLDECLRQERLVKLKIDKRKELEDKQSIFLHRLNWLNVGLAQWLEAPSGDLAGGGLFAERWGLKWSPEVESNLIDCNMYGDTIESASMTRFRELLAEHDTDAGTASGLLVDAITMDLPNIVQEVEEVLGSAIDSDTRFSSLAHALANLVILERYAMYRNLRKGVVDDLLERCFDRACFSVIETISVPEELQPDVVSGLMTIAEIIQRGDRPDLDKNLFVEHVRNAAAASEVPFLRGVFLGVLTEMRVNTTEDLAKELSALARAPVEIMITAGDFLDGIMAASRTSIMLGAKSLIAAVDELLQAAEWEPFLTMVPKMRAAFERLHDSQLNSVADNVAKLYGLKDADSLTELRTSVEGAALIVQIDRRVAQIMSEWDF